MPKPSIYLETTIIGLLTNRPSKNILIEAHRQMTLQWWEKSRKNYDLFISQAVLAEIAKGDPQAVQDRLTLVEGISQLVVNEKIELSANDLVRVHALPVKALQDAFHISIAAHYQLDILLTWNCTHIANPHILKLVRRYFAGANLSIPEVVTPESLLGGEND